MIKNGTTYSDDTSIQLMDIIEVCRQEKKRIRLWYGKDGVSWDEENDIIGYVGRSTGERKIPLLIANTRSMGGGALLTGSIIKIVDIKAKEVLYQHRNFKQSFFGADDTLVYKGKPGIDEEIWANCKTWEQAKRLAAFMNGERHSK